MIPFPNRTKISEKKSHLPIDSKYKGKWESDYPLTLLQEAFNKGLTEVLGMSIEEVEKKYPSISL